MTTKEPTSPRTMKNTIWERPMVKRQNKNWTYKKHDRVQSSRIAFVKPSKGGYTVLGAHVPTFDEAKILARTKQYDKVRMGAIVSKL